MCKRSRIRFKNDVEMRTSIDSECEINRLQMIHKTHQKSTHECVFIKPDEVRI